MQIFTHKWFYCQKQNWGIFRFLLNSVLYADPLLWFPQKFLLKFLHERKTEKFPLLVACSHWTWIKSHQKFIHEHETGSLILRHTVQYMRCITISIVPTTGVSFRFKKIKGPQSSWLKFTFTNDVLITLVYFK